MARMMRGKKGLIKDHSGERFGRLLVVDIAKSDPERGLIWNCICDCGQKKAIRGDSLRRGATTSCGCLRIERAVAATKLACITHGMTKTKEYAAYLSMKERCYVEKSESYKHYGARGIVVCQRWRVSDGFADFLAKIGEAPGQDYSVDRKDVNGNYSCGECDECLANGWAMNIRWATRWEQANNRTNNHVLIFEGKRMTISEWAREIGIKSSTLMMRIRRGWSAEDAITTPIGAK